MITSVLAYLISFWKFSIDFISFYLETKIIQVLVAEYYDYLSPIVPYHIRQR